MPEPCVRCGGPHPFHVVVRARCARRWRGRNFDAAAAEGAAGAALLRAVGMDPARDFARFAEVGVIASVREDVDENPAEKFDTAEGETWEFHLALREPLAPGVAEAARAAVRAAIGDARNFDVVDVRG